MADQHTKFSKLLTTYRASVDKYYNTKEKIWDRIQQVINSIGCAFGDPDLWLNFWFDEPTDDDGYGHVNPNDLEPDSSFGVDCRPSDCNIETYTFLRGGIPSMYLYMTDKEIIKDVQERCATAQQKAKDEKQTVASLVASARAKLTSQEWAALGIVKGNS